MAKMTRGRQRIKMAKMENESNLQVTFSKRRSGLFKKASELCTLCAADVGIIVFSPGDKAYSFGHPSVDAVVDRYVSEGGANPRAPHNNIDPGTLQIMEAHRSASLREMNIQLGHRIALLEFERKRAEELKESGKETRKPRGGWKGPISDLGPQELAELRASLDELQKKVAKEAERVIMEAASQPPPPLPPNFRGASSSGAGPSGAMIPYDLNNIGDLNGGVYGGEGFNGAPIVPYVAYNNPYGPGFY